MLKTHAKIPVPKSNQSQGLDLPIDPNVIQDNTEWCWAACVLVVLELKAVPPPAGSAQWTQCLVAGSAPSFAGLTCCPDKPAGGGANPCNAGLDTGQIDVLFHTDGIKSVLTPHPLTNAQALIDELNATRPVGIRLAWTAVSGHVLVVFGWHRKKPNAVPSFDVFDPAEGSGVVVSFAGLLEYHKQGTWTHTFTHLTS